MSETPIAPSKAAPVRDARARTRRLLSRFRRSENGATAIEFAAVLTPFLMLLFAIFEVAMMLWTSSILEESLAQASRSLLTGQSKTLYKGSSTDNATAFRDAICARATKFVDCDKITIDVRSYANFASAQSGTTSPVQNGALNTNGFGYSQPAAKQIVVVRAVLDYSLYFTQWSKALADIGAGKRAIVASATFRTEPFS